MHWSQVTRSSMILELGMSYEERLLRHVNRRMEASLDLEKISNLQTDTEIVPDGPQVAGDEEGPSPGGGDDGGEDGGGEPGDPDAPGSDGTPADPPGLGGRVGQPRAPLWHELRDLKLRLREEPYFGLDDLPRRVEESTPDDD